jgi:hypothetical protein
MKKGQEDQYGCAIKETPNHALQRNLLVENLSGEFYIISDDFDH